MNTSLISSLVALALAGSVPAAPDGPQRKADIVDTAVAAGFDTLATALKAANLTEGLRGGGPFTVFAPTDEAFAKLPKETLASLLRPENREQLRGILSYHVVPGRVAAKDIVHLRFATTLNGQRALIRLDGDQIRIDDARIRKTDIECSNGVIHVIDSVILPANDDIVATARSAGTFGTLLKAGQAAGLAKLILGDGPFTVLAPTDEAFAKLPKGTLASLLERRNRSKLAAILKYHVIPGRVYADQAASAGQAETLQRQAVEFSIRSGQLRANLARVVGNDIQASNGVIHVIDSVLVPSIQLPEPRKVLGISYTQPGAALAAQLGLDRQKTLVVTAVSSGGNAAEAGIQRYDVITAVAGLPATDRNVSRAKRTSDLGEGVELRIQRRGEQLVINVPIGLASH